MVQRRTDKGIIRVDKKRDSAVAARAALAEKRALEREVWRPAEMPPGIPRRPENIVDYIVDMNLPTGETFGSYAALARALGTGRQNVSQWRERNRIPEQFIPAIIMHTGINPSVLVLWNSAYYGCPAAVREREKEKQREA